MTKSVIFESMNLFEIFFTFLKLGVTSFGGPIAHLGYFHDEFVKKKNWISDHAYADLVALCQFLPGPASSQVGMAIGLSRGGLLGAIAAWMGFTLPSAFILVFFALGLNYFETGLHANWLHTLKIVAVAVVAHAVLAMGRKLCPDKERIIIALVSSIVVLLFHFAFTQIIVIVISGVLGALALKDTSDLPHAPISSGLSKKTASIFLTLFLALLFVLPIIRSINPDKTLSLFDSFYRSGSLVFGGGHVVLPLIQAEVVPTGRITNDLFMAGYGLAQAIPGPLFTFSAYVGFIAKGWGGSLVALIGAFLPSFLLVIGSIPFWERLRNFSRMRRAMLGVNASVVGILLAALYHPVWTSAIFTMKDFILACFGFLLLQLVKLPSWSVVAIMILVSMIIV